MDVGGEAFTVAVAVAVVAMPRRHDVASCAALGCAVASPPAVASWTVSFRRVRHQAPIRPVQCGGNPSRASFGSRPD
jgi:hypothetical protein